MYENIWALLLDFFGDSVSFHCFHFVAHPLVYTSASTELERKHRTHSLEFQESATVVLRFWSIDGSCFACVMCFPQVSGLTLQVPHVRTTDKSSPFGIPLGSVVRKGQAGNSCFSSEMTFPPSLERAGGMGRRLQQFPQSTVLQHSQEAWPGSCPQQF